MIAFKCCVSFSVPKQSLLFLFISVGDWEFPDLFFHQGHKKWEEGAWGVNSLRSFVRKYKGCDCVLDIWHLSCCIAVVHDQHCPHLQPMEEQWDPLLCQWPAGILRWHGLACKHKWCKFKFLNVFYSMISHCNISNGYLVETCKFLFESFYLYFILKLINLYLYNLYLILKYSMQLFQTHDLMIFKKIKIEWGYVVPWGQVI